MVFSTPASPRGSAMWAIAVQANIATAPSRPAKTIRVLVFISVSERAAIMRSRCRRTQAPTLTTALDRADPVAFHQLLAQIHLHIRSQPAQDFFAPRRVH